MVWPQAKDHLELMENSRSHLQRTLWHLPQLHDFSWGLRRRQVVRDVDASGYEWLLANSLVASHLSAYGT